MDGQKLKYVSAVVTVLRQTLKRNVNKDLKLYIVDATLYLQIILVTVIH
jgi:hypothetical protein